MGVVAQQLRITKCYHSKDLQEFVANGSTDVFRIVHFWKNCTPDIKMKHYNTNNLPKHKNVLIKWKQIEFYNIKVSGAHQDL